MCSDCACTVGLDFLETVVSLYPAAVFRNCATESEARFKILNICGFHFRGVDFIAMGFVSGKVYGHFEKQAINCFAKNRIGVEEVSVVDLKL